jgi:hypothetical protein
MTQPFQDREAERRDVAMAARCRTFSGLRHTALLTDISTHGCCVTCQGLLFAVGTRLVIQPEGMEGIAGVVRWIAKDRAGVEFDVPLYPPIVEHLSRQHPADVRADVTLVSP